MRSTQTLILLAAAAAAHAQTTSAAQPLPSPPNSPAYTSQLAVFQSAAKIYDSIDDKRFVWETALPGYTSLVADLSQLDDWNAPNSSPTPGASEALHRAKVDIPWILPRLEAIKELVNSKSYFPEEAKASFVSDIEAQISAGVAQVSVENAWVWGTERYITASATEETSTANTEETSTANTEETSTAETEETKPTGTEETKPTETEETKPAETSQEAGDNAAGKVGSAGVLAVVAMAGLAAVFCSLG